MGWDESYDILTVRYVGINKHTVPRQNLELKINYQVSERMFIFVKHWELIIGNKNKSYKSNRA